MVTMMVTVVLVLRGRLLLVGRERAMALLMMRRIWIGIIVRDGDRMPLQTFER